MAQVKYGTGTIFQTKDGRWKWQGYFIDKTEHGWRICKEDNADIHTHLKNLNPSYKLIDNVVNHKIPTRCGLYYIQSHIRLADNEEYKQKLQDYYFCRNRERFQRDELPLYNLYA